MKQDKNSVEFKHEIKRRFISILITILIHIILFLLILISGSFKPKEQEKDIIVTVQLHDKIIELSFI